MRPCSLGTPNSISPPTPASTASTAALRSDSRECCTTPGMLLIGRGSSTPFCHEHRQHQLARPQASSPRPAAASPACVRRRRGREAGKPAISNRPALRSPDGAGRAPLGRLRDGLAGLDQLQPSDARRSRPTLRRASSTDGVDASTSTRSPCSSHVFAVAGPIAAITVEACGLPAMPTRLRTVEDDVNTTASNLPDLIASRVGAGRRRGAHGAVSRDVVDLPAQLVQTGDELLGRDVRARQEDAVDRVEQVVVRRPVLEQAHAPTAHRTEAGRRGFPRLRSLRRSSRRPRRP